MTTCYDLRYLFYPPTNQRGTMSTDTYLVQDYDNRRLRAQCTSSRMHYFYFYFYFYPPSSLLPICKHVILSVSSYLLSRPLIPLHRQDNT